MPILRQLIQIQSFCELESFDRLGSRDQEVSSIGVTVRAFPKDVVLIICDPVGFGAVTYADSPFPPISVASPKRFSAPWPLPSDSRLNPDCISGP